ncbi:uL15m family ribosomal protein, partial [Bacteroidota bacterium]
NRGGRGNAGSGKRGDGKKPSFWKDKSYYKSKGFTSLKSPLESINIKQLSKIEETKINLKEMGYDKLLGTGTPDRKYEITVSQVSESAIEKIKKAGGTVSGLAEKKVKVKKEVSEKPTSKPVEEAEEAEVTEEETVDSAEE